MTVGTKHGSPKISVCLPLFNGAAYLTSAIDSIRNQSEQSWELIIVDDCSTDDSRQIALMFAEQDSRIYLHQNAKRLGHSGNYSKSIQLAKGNYIKLFAQDDLLASTALEELSQVLDEKPEIGLVTCARRVITPEASEIEVIRPFASSRLIAGKDAIIYNLLYLTNWVGEPSTGMCRRSLVSQGFDPSLYHYADCDFWFHLLENSDYYYLDSVLCNYRRHEQAVTRRTLSSLAFACDVVRLGKKYKKYFDQFGDTEELFNARAVEIISQHIDHLRRNNNLSLQKVLTTTVTDENSPNALAEQASYISDLKELLFIYSTYVTKQLAESHAKQCKALDDLENLERQKAALLSSTSWKATAPFRHIIERTRRRSSATQDAISTMQISQEPKRNSETVELGGIKLLVGDYMSSYMKEVLRSGDYDKEGLRIVSHQLKPTDRVLEIGTGIGLLSAYCAKRLGSERVYTYEANPELESPIRNVYAINKVEPKLSMCMLGEGEGTKAFYLMPDFWASSQIKLSSDARKITVPLKSLNAELRATKASFLIIDIEGGEYELIMSADLSQVERIAIEIHRQILGEDKCKEVIERIQSAGFALDSTTKETQVFFFKRETNA